jgi:hypothetical protein
MSKKPSANRANHAKARVTARGARKPGGRVTPKGTRPAGHSRPVGATAAASSRYTPPTPRASKITPQWVKVAFPVLLATGVLGVFLNYLSVLPGAPSYWWLVASLLSILLSILSATQFR